MDPKTATAKTWPPEEELDTPYKRARQEWDSRLGSTILQAKNWRLATFASLALVLLSICGLIYLGAQPKVVPHIVEVDHLGEATYHGAVGQSGDTFQPSEATINYHLRRWLTEVRTISTDPAVVKSNWIDAYHFMTQTGANMLTSYVQEPAHDPFKRLQEERVTVEVISTVPLTKDTWQLDWKENFFNRTGQQQTSQIWRVMLRFVVHPSDKAEELRHNPIGLYIDEFHWDRVQDGKSQ